MTNTYGITVSADEDRNINALADPGGIDPAYEGQQQAEDLKGIENNKIKTKKK